MIIVLVSFLLTWKNCLKGNIRSNCVTPEIAEFEKEKRNGACFLWKYTTVARRYSLKIVKVLTIAIYLVKSEKVKIFPIVSWKMAQASSICLAYIFPFFTSLLLVSQFTAGKENENRSLKVLVNRCYLFYGMLDLL